MEVFLRGMEFDFVPNQTREGFGNSNKASNRFSGRGEQNPFNNNDKQFRQGGRPNQNVNSNYQGNSFNSNINNNNRSNPLSRRGPAGQSVGRASSNPFVVETNQGAQRSFFGQSQGGGSLFNNNRTASGNNPFDRRNTALENFSQEGEMILNRSRERSNSQLRNQGRNNLHNSGNNNNNPFQRRSGSNNVGESMIEIEEIAGNHSPVNQSNSGRGQKSYNQDTNNGIVGRMKKQGGNFPNAGDFQQRGPFRQKTQNNNRNNEFNTQETNLSRNREGANERKVFQSRNNQQQEKGGMEVESVMERSRTRERSSLSNEQKDGNSQGYFEQQRQKNNQPSVNNLFKPIRTNNSNENQRSNRLSDSKSGLFQGNNNKQAVSQEQNRSIIRQPKDKDLLESKKAILQNSNKPSITLGQTRVIRRNQNEQ